MSEEDFQRGYADGAAGKPPDINSLALGRNYLNDYEKGYVHSGADMESVVRGREDAAVQR